MPRVDDLGASHTLCVQASEIHLNFKQECHLALTGGRLIDIFTRPPTLFVAVFQIHTYEVYFHNFDFELNKIMKSNRFLFIFVDKIMKTWILRDFHNSTHYES